MSADETLETTVAVLTERIRGMEKATTLQAAEYERRLDFLNGEASQLKAMQERYVPRETYDADTKADRAWKSVTERQMSNWSGRLAALGIVLSVVLALGLALIKVWK